VTHTHTHTHTHTQSRSVLAALVHSPFILVSMCRHQPACGHRRLISSRQLAHITHTTALSTALATGRAARWRHVDQGSAHCSRWRQDHQRSPIVRPARVSVPAVLRFWSNTLRRRRHDVSEPSLGWLLVLLGAVSSLPPARSLRHSHRLSSDMCFGLSLSCLRCLALLLSASHARHPCCLLSLVSGYLLLSVPGCRATARHQARRLRAAVALALTSTVFSLHTHSHTHASRRIEKSQPSLAHFTYSHARRVT